MPAGRGPLPGPRGEARPELGGLASAPPAGRLHLLSETLSHICALCSCRGGGSAGLGAIIWEDAVPCPAGAVVSPLKNPAPHCSEALQPGYGGHLPPAWRKEPRPPRTPCLAAAPAGCPWSVGTPPPPNPWPCAASGRSLGRPGPRLTARTAVQVARRSA